MKALSGHFDGKYVVLDDPAALRPNTRVTVLAPENGESEADLRRDFTRLSAGTFKTIWDNSLDADYDKL